MSMVLKFVKFRSLFKDMHTIFVILSVCLSVSFSVPSILLVNEFILQLVTRQVKCRTFKNHSLSIVQTVQSRGLLYSDVLTSYLWENNKFIPEEARKVCPWTICTGSRVWSSLHYASKHSKCYYLWHLLHKVWECTCFKDMTCHPT